MGVNYKLKARIIEQYRNQHRYAVAAGRESHRDRYRHAERLLRWQRSCVGHRGRRGARGEAS